MTQRLEKLSPYNDGKRRRMFMKGLTNVAILPGGGGANPEANVCFYKSAEKQEKRPGETDAQFRARMRREEAEKQERRRRRRRGDKDYDKAGEGEAEKAGDLVDMATSATDGHQHAISVSVYDDEMYLTVHYARGSDDEAPGVGHDHQVIRNTDGTFTVTENAGHTHEIDGAEIQRIITDRLMKSGEELPEEGPLADFLAAVKEGENSTQPGGDTMPDDTKELDALKAQVASLTAVAALSGVHKAHYDTLGDSEKEAFVKMDAADRDKAIKAEEAAKADADPVVYKCEATGEEFRKSDDQRMVSMAKQMDEDRKETIRLQKKSADDDLTKRAEDDLSHFPGDLTVRKSILKAVDGIEDEDTRKAALDALKAQDAKLAPAFTTVGAGGTPAVKADTQTEAESELDKLAKDRAAKDKTDFYTAYEKVAEENPTLLAKAMG